MDRRRIARQLERGEHGGPRLGKQRRRRIVVEIDRRTVIERALGATGAASKPAAPPQGVREGPKILEI
jgi:hypothetical protein